jgi:hypothetical protein
MNKTVIILALMLVLGIVVVSGCTTTTQNNTSGMGQNKSPTTAGYSIGQIVNIESGNNVNEGSVEESGYVSGS